jgi:hypothetical protein
VSSKALGGAPFLAQIQTTHAAYGKALGVTEAKKSAAPTTAGVLAALDDVNDALREYRAKVAASVSKKKPKTAEVAAHLLDPVTRIAADKRLATATPVAPGAPAETSATTSSSGTRNTTGS